MEKFFEFIIVVAIFAYMLGIIYFLMYLAADISVFLYSKKKVWKAIDRILISFVKTEDYDRCIFDIKNVLENTTSWSIKTPMPKWVKYISETLKKYLYDLNTKQSADELQTEIVKEKVRYIIDRYEKEHPVEGLTGVNGIAINKFIQDINSDNKEALIPDVKEIAKALEKSDEENKKNKRFNTLQTVLSVVGLVVTIFSAVMAFY